MSKSAARKNEGQHSIKPKKEVAGESVMSSRERMLAALNCRKPDHVPCRISIPPPRGLKFADVFASLDWQLKQGVDVVVNIPSLPIRFAPEVTIREWKEQPSGAPYPVLHREYGTPVGKLTVAAYQTPDWRYGDQVPLFDDFLSCRCVKFLITQQSDLAAFKYLLPTPTDEDIVAYQKMAAPCRKYAHEREVLLEAGWQSQNGNAENPEFGLVGHDGGIMGGDALLWLCGPEALLWTYDQPEFLQELLHLIGVWNRQRMRVVLDAGVDMVAKRGWYEIAPFYSPTHFRKFMFPELREEAALVHQAGAKLVFHTTTGILPFLDAIIEAGVDLIDQVDPAPCGGNDLKALAEGAAGRIALSGGVSVPFQLENATSEEVRQRVALSIQTLGAYDGFILRLVGSSMTVPDERQQTIMERNMNAVIEAWRETR